MMKTMTDIELDILFAESAQRHHGVKQINRQVMRTVRRDLRRKRLRKLAKLLGISFGLPVAVVVYVYALFIFMPQMPEQLRIACFVLPLGTIVLFLARKLRGFSLTDM